MSAGRWLAIAVAVYFVVSFALSWLRAVELQTTTWDQGIYQQALWMTAHGRPFFETADVETGGYASLLEVHSVFLLYLVVPLYALLPYQATLFAVQSAVVGLAAVPLYLLARDVTRSPRLGLFAGLAYLCWTPTLSSNLYDFHVEAFLPVEIFALVFLWNRGRYAAGFAVAAVAFLTLEFAPVIVVALGLFALVPGTLAVSTFAPFRTRVRAGLGPALREWVRTPRVRASLVLVAASAVAYVALLVLRVDILPGVLGTYPLPAAATGYVIGGTPSALGLSWTNLGVGFGPKVTYWLLVVGLLAFVPLLAYRALILTAPWFVFTLFSSNLNYVTLGFQYGLVVASTVMVAFVFGLPRAQRAVDAWLETHRGAPSVPAGPDPPRRRARPLRTVVLVGVVALLVLNVALTPVNPAMQNTGLGSAYRLSYDPAAGASGVVRLAAMIPPGATVLATDVLFPLVANDAHAYSFSWAPDPTLALPFTRNAPPPYVFLSEDRSSVVPSWLVNALYDRSAYGVRGVAWASPAGTVLLFQTGYTGPVAEFGTDPARGGIYYGSSLASNSVGFPIAVSGSTFPLAVQSLPGTLGTVWYGPDVTLPAGNYSLTLSLRLAALAGFPAPNPSTPALWIGAFAFGQPTFYGWSFSFDSLNTSSFTNVTFRVALPAPTIEFDVQGQLLQSSVQVTLNYLEIAAE